jgi:cold shock protein
MQRTIKKLVRDRGFGFISADDGKEIFFHRTALRERDFDSLSEGQKVEFEVERTDKGSRAAKVRVSGA